MPHLQRGEFRHMLRSQVQAPTAMTLGAFLVQHLHLHHHLPVRGPRLL
jgi:hypothetical protein